MRVFGMDLQNRVRKRPRRMTFGAISLSAMAAVTVLGLVPAGPAVAEEQVKQASDVASAAAEHAKKQVGKPYRYGGTGPGSFDCSGLVQWSYKKAGKSLSRTTYSQIAEGKAAKRSNLRKGDLVFLLPGSQPRGNIPRRREDGARAQTRAPD